MVSNGAMNSGKILRLNLFLQILFLSMVSSK